MSWRLTMILVALQGLVLCNLAIAQQAADPGAEPTRSVPHAAPGDKSGEKFLAELDLSLESLPGVLEFVAPSNSEQHWGSDIKTGDVNGDGFVDVVMLANSASVEGRTRSGAVYVFFGPWDWSTPRDFSAPDVLMAGNYSYAYAWGLVVADLDDDGIDDIASGHAGINSYVPVANVMFGRNEWPATIDLHDEADCQIRGQGGSNLGAAMVSGDLDADGLIDLAIYAPRHDGLGRTDCGATFIISGDLGWPAEIDALETTAVFGPHAYAGTSNGNYFPQGNLAVGDLNGDGVDDLVIASGGVDGPGTDLDDDRGGAFVLFGGTDWPDSTDLASEASVTIYGESAGDLLHRVTIEDVDGDGRDDLGLGAFWVDRTTPEGQTLENCGAVYVVRGRANWPAVFPLAEADHRILGGDTGDGIGNHRFGDLDRDGLTDVVVGMVGYGPGGNRIASGRMVIVYGHDLEAEVDLRGYPGTVVYGPAEYALLNGWDSSHLADLDDDGGLDLLVGAPRDWNARGGGAYAIDGTVLSVRQQDIALVEITNPADQVGPLGTVIPQALAANRGATVDTARVTLEIGAGYRSTRTVVLSPSEELAIDLDGWLPDRHGSYAIEGTSTLLVYGQPRADEDPRNDQVVRRVRLDPPTGLVVDEILTETLVNDATGELVAVGRGFSTEAQASLQLAVGDLLTPISVTVAGDTMLTATFDIPADATEGEYDLVVRNDTGEEYEYQDAVRIVEFEGQSISLDRQWTPFSVIEGTVIEVGFSVPTGVDDLFVLVKKTTHIGYDGTWAGTMALYRGDVEVARCNVPHYSSPTIPH